MTRILSPGSYSIQTCTSPSVQQLEYPILQSVVKLGRQSQCTFKLSLFPSCDRHTIQRDRSLLPTGRNANLQNPLARFRLPGDERTFPSRITRWETILQPSIAINVTRGHFPSKLVDNTLSFGFCRTLRLGFGLRRRSGGLISTLSAAESEAREAVRSEVSGHDSQSKRP